jgi:hypothetical protein
MVLMSGMPQFAERCRLAKILIERAANACR